MKSISQAEAADLARVHSGNPWAEVIDLECPEDFVQAGLPDSAFCFDGTLNHILLCSSGEGLFMPKDGWTSWLPAPGMYANAVPFQRDDIRDTTDSYGRVLTALSLGDSEGLLAAFLDANSGCCGWKATVYSVMIADQTVYTDTVSGVTLTYQKAEPPDLGVPFTVASAASDGQGITVSLSSSTELDRKFPPRIMLKNYCQLTFGSPECAASGLVYDREYASLSGTGDHSLDFIDGRGLVKCGDRLGVLDFASGSVLLAVSARVVWAEMTWSAGEEDTVVAWYVAVHPSYSSRLYPGIIVIEDGEYKAYGNTSISLTNYFSDGQYASGNLADRLRRSFSATDSALYYIDCWTSSPGVFKSNAVRCVERTGAHGIQAVGSLGFLDSVCCCQVSMRQRWAGCGIFTSGSARSTSIYGAAVAFTGKASAWYRQDLGVDAALALALWRDADVPEDDDPENSSSLEMSGIVVNDRGQDLGRGYFFYGTPKDAYAEPLETLAYRHAPVDFSDVQDASGLACDSSDYFGMRMFWMPSDSGMLIVDAEGYVTATGVDANVWLGGDGGETSRYCFFDTASQTFFEWNPWDDEPFVAGNCGPLYAALVYGRDYSTYIPLGCYVIRDGVLCHADLAVRRPCSQSLADCRRRGNRARFGGFAGIGNGGLLE